MCASDMKIVFYDSRILLFRFLEEIKYSSGLFYYLERAVRFQKSLLWTETTCPGFFVSHDGHISEYQMIHQIVGYSSSGRKRKGKHNPSIFFFIYTTSKSFALYNCWILSNMILIKLIKAICIVWTQQKFRAPQIVSFVHEVTFDLDLDLCLEVDLRKHSKENKITTS